MRRATLQSLSKTDRKELLTRSQSNVESIQSTVRGIFHDIAKAGDRAVRSYTKKYDGLRVEDFEVTADEIVNALNSIDPTIDAMIRAATLRIFKFHEAQKPQPLHVETASGVICSREWRSIDRIGLYIPGGTAPLVSTVLMLSIPAAIAGCENVIVCMPPGKDGTIAKPILFAAALCNVGRIFKVGGAQAIGAMAIGTESIPKVDKIFGPGSRIVAEAKALASQSPYNTAVDLYAGPTELMVIADDAANAAYVASDLLAQAEHGEDSQVILLGLSDSLLDQVQSEINAQLPKLPRRAIIEKVLENSSALRAASVEEAIAFANEYAPEHLLLAVQNPEQYSPAIRNAGSVFLGAESSSVFGDYASGTNHTLPTLGAARASGGVTVESFMKPIFFEQANAGAIDGLSSIAETIAGAEGLDGHAAAAALRRSTPGDPK